ncbi:hypothetical protein GCM10008957_47120 [Deinococcus ruber]|uniref:Bacterial transcriptional activator domain-containing protein n=1 Tax=Deinococcus ruber TaxID=1848197 RepID=A0A918CLJ7_9DEIO|nr:hypothetical protein GCM10008957_47120 [Deinococcus ruber]
MLGSATLTRADGGSVRLDRKTLTLLAYLGLEGVQSRAQLSALLWPDTPAAAARNNLVHLLRRLKAASGADLVRSEGQQLRLAPQVQLDVLNVLGEHPLGPPPPFLDGHDFDDCLDLTDWVHSQREAVLVRWLTAQRQAIVQAQANGQLQQALAVAEALLLADPLSEEAHRSVMSLQYALGDRSAALRAYQRCKALLHSEVGVEPSPETVRLAREIGEGTLPLATPDNSIPLSVLRPPTLVGRESEWARMEQAWAAGLGIMVIGEAGSGKSRLAVDFLRSKTSHQLLLFGGRPGDAAAPYTTHARTYRQVLGAYPDLDLPDWVRRELARIIPELALPGAAEAGPDAQMPLRSEADKLRFYEAKVEMIRRVALRGPVILASDDLHYMDEASIEAGGYVFSKFFGDADTNLRTLFCFRTDALSGLAAAVAQQMIDAGLAVPIRLGPLDDRAVASLLSEIEVPSDAALASDVWRFTHGNPQFVLETVKAMFETQTFTVGQPGETLSGNVAQQITERLGRLSEAALHAARAAAVLQSEVTLERVAEVLHIGLLDIATAWEELEQAQITRGERFAHDLLFEAVLAQIPAATRRLLHRSAARVLSAPDQGSWPTAAQQAAEVARHWLSGGEPLQAAPWLMKAAQAAEATLRLSEAASFYHEAAAAYDAANLPSEAQEARAAERAAQLRAAV